MCLIVLGSQRFDRLPQLLPRDPQDTPLAYVPTAADLLDDPEWIGREPDALHDMGFPITILSLTGAASGEVAAVLASTVAVYLAGGNPWYLLHQANLSGFTSLVPDLVESGRLIYVGMSAGAHLATPDLLPSVRETTRDIVPGLVTTCGMGLVPFSVVTHFGQEHRAEHHAEILSRPQVRPLVPITDEQFIVVRGGSWSVVSAMP
jgi:dipeptidase E